MKSQQRYKYFKKPTWIKMTSCEDTKIEKIKLDKPTTFREVLYIYLRRREKRGIVTPNLIYYQIQNEETDLCNLDDCIKEYKQVYYFVHILNYD